MKVLIFVQLILVVISCVLAEFPSSIHKCANGDSGCLVNISQSIIQSHPQGRRDINLMTFDPLRIKTLKLDRNPSSPVNIELKFQDLDMIGLTNTQVKSVTGFNADLSGRNSFEAFIPELILKGHYVINGRVLIVPIVGDGNSEITCKNLKIKYGFDLKPIEKNGQIYAEFDHVKLEILPENVHFAFENLFNGDQALGENMNKFINENWYDIFHELEPGMAKAISLIIKHLLNGVFSKYPYAVYFQ